MKTSAFFSIKQKDLVKGFIMAMLMVIVTGLYTALSATPVHFPSVSEMQTIGLTGFASGLAYLIKNLFTNSDDEFLKKEN